MRQKTRIYYRKNYEYNNGGSLPTLIYRTQPDFLKTPEGDTSNKGKMVYIFGRRLLEVLEIRL